MAEDQFAKQSGLSTGEAPPVVEPMPHAIAEVGRLRMRELRNISDRCGRFPRWPMAAIWWAAAAILLGAALGALPAGTQLDPKTDHTIYWALTVGALIAGVLCLVAGFTTHTERVESISSIKEDLDKLLDVYPDDSA